MSEMLKLCPFCGAKANYTAYGPHRHQVDCGDPENCLACVGTPTLYTKEDAFKAWNTRSHDESMVLVPKATLRAIAEGYRCFGAEDRYIFVENPNFKQDDGSDRSLIIDLQAISAIPEDRG